MALLPQQARTPVPDSVLVPVGDAKTLFVPQGDDLEGDRDAFVSRVWRNATDRAVSPVVEYTAYNRRSVPVGTCEARAEFVPPGGLVNLYCTAFATRGTARGVVVTSRVTSVIGAQSANANAAIVDPEVNRKVTSRGLALYSVRVNVQTQVDLDAIVNFYLLTKTGVQLAECSSWTTRFQPEVARRVEEKGCAEIPRRLGAADSIIVTLTRP